MTARINSIVLCGVFILVACMPATIPVPTKTAAVPTPTETTTPLQASTSRALSIAYPDVLPTTVLSTPLNIPSVNNRNINSIIDKLLPDLCFGFRGNLAILTPPPPDVGVPPSDIEFAEIGAIPTPDMVYGYIRADNINKTGTAYSSEIDAAYLYIKDNTNNKIYEIDIGGWPVLEGLQWINEDTIFFLQEAHNGNVVSAINVVTHQYEYYSESSGCPDISTP